MALYFFEQAKSRDVTRELDNAQVTLRWVALRSTDEAAVYSGLVGPAGVAPLYRDGMRRGSVALKHEGAGLWFCDVVYKWSRQTEDPTQDKDNPEKPLGPEWAFDQTAATVHLTQSRKTVSKTVIPDFFPNNTAPDFRQAIGVTFDAVQGVDAFVPKMEGTLTITRKFITPAYAATCYRLTGKTNKGPFFSWKAGEVLYLGASITVQPDQTEPQAKVTHKFAFGENKTDIVIRPGDVGQPGLTVREKAAWDYLWCGYYPFTVGGNQLQLPVSAYVEQIYEEGDFDPLLEIV